jgi:hypothetical protein
MNNKELEFLGKSTKHFNELVNTNIAMLLNVFLHSGNVNERKEIIQMIDILRMTRKK